MIKNKFVYAVKILYIHRKFCGEYVCTRKKKLDKLPFGASLANRKCAVLVKRYKIYCKNER